MVATWLEYPASQFPILLMQLKQEQCFSALKFTSSHLLYIHTLEPCIPDNKMTCCTKMHEGPASVATEPWAPWSGSVISETMEAISEPSRCHIDTPCYAHNDACQHWNHTGRVTYAGCMTAAGHVLHRSTAACVQCPPVLLKNPLYP